MLEYIWWVEAGARDHAPLAWLHFTLAHGRPHRTAARILIGAGRWGGRGWTPRRLKPRSPPRCEPSSRAAPKSAAKADDSSGGVVHAEYPRGLVTRGTHEDSSCGVLTRIRHAEYPRGFVTRSTHEDSSRVDERGGGTARPRLDGRAHRTMLTRAHASSRELTRARAGAADGAYMSSRRKSSSRGRSSGGTSAATTALRPKV